MVLSLDVNLWAVLLCGVIAMILGSLWYSPLLFGNMWMAELGFTKKSMEEMKGEMTKTYILTFLGSLVMAYVLAHVVSFANAKSALEGALVGFWLWLGFIVTYGLGGVLFEKRPATVFLISIGYQLVSVLIFGAVLAVWA